MTVIVGRGPTYELEDSRAALDDVGDRPCGPDTLERPKRPWTSFHQSGPSDRPEAT